MRIQGLKLNLHVQFGTVLSLIFITHSIAYNIRKGAT